MAVAYRSNPETADTSDDVSERAEPIYGCSGNIRSSGSATTT
jgi:hypothetical protein